MTDGLFSGPVVTPHPPCEYGNPGDCLLDALYVATVSCGCRKQICWPHVKLVGDHVDRGGFLKCDACASAGRVGRDLGLLGLQPLKTAAR